MGNYRSTKEEIRNNLIARVPLIIVRSAERERMERMLRELAKELHTEIYYYTDVRQICALPSGAEKDADHDPISFFQETLKRKHGATLAMGDAKRVSGDNSFSRELLDTLYLALENAGTILLVVQDEVWGRLAQFGMLTTLDYPDAEERESQLQRFVKAYGSRFTIQWDQEDIHQAALLLRGFSEVQIENILSTTLVSRGKLDKGDLYALTSQKSRMYGSVACIEEVRVSKEMKISGLENLRDWIRKRKQLFFISDEVLARRGLTTPKGILLCGVPGCGKSYSARMVALEWGLPLFRFDIGAVYDKWVGESERKMADALQFINNVAPCILWIDEIEKALSTAELGNDTGQRVLGQFLYWLQEDASRVFLVATSNDVTRLPAELFRKGRFSETFFVDLPNEAEREAAIRQYMGQCLHRSPDNEELSRLTECSQGFSYADIEYVIKEAAQQELLEPDCHYDLDALFRSNLSFAATNPDAVERLRAWGRERAVPASRQAAREECK